MSARRLGLAALALVAAAGCNNASYVELRLSSGQPIVVRRFDVTVENSGQTGHVTFAPAKPVALPPTQTLALSFGHERKGSVKLAVVATTDDGTLGAGPATTTLSVGGTVTVDLALTPGGAPDLDGGTDGGPNLGPDMVIVPSGPPVAFSITPGKTTVNEHEKFQIEIVALDGTGSPMTNYNGAPTLTSDWGDVTAASAPHFVNGDAKLLVSLNRETNAGLSPAHLTVRDGDVKATSANITVVAPAWQVDGSKARLHNTHTKSNMTVTDPCHPGAIIPDPAGAGYLLFYDRYVFMGLVTNPTGMSIATSPDGLDWSNPIGGYLPMSSDIPTNVSAHWNGTQFEVIATNTDSSNNRSLEKLISPTANTMFTKVAVEPAPTNSMCQIGSVGRLLADSAYALLVESIQFCVTRDSGSTVMAGLTHMDRWSGLLRDGTVYKLWGQLDNTSDGTTTTVYFTSGDGVNWVKSSAAPDSHAIYAVYWNAANQQYEGLTQTDATNSSFIYYRIFRP